MPKLLSIVIILFSCTAVYCQNADNEGSVLLNKQPNWERLLQKTKPPKISGYQSPQQAMPIALGADTARYSHRTNLGNVYALPQDNMPCLVPNQQNVAAMPGTFGEKHTPMPSLPAANSIPNSLGQKPLVFEKPVEPAKK